MLLRLRHTPRSTRQPGTPAIKNYVPGIERTARVMQRKELMLRNIRWESNSTKTKSKKLSTTKQDAPWFAEGLHFSCTACGKCCTGPSGFVWIHADDARAISKKLGISEKAFYKQYTRYIPSLKRYTLTERLRVRSPQNNSGQGAKASTVPASLRCDSEYDVPEHLRPQMETPLDTTHTNSTEKSTNEGDASTAEQNTSDAVEDWMGEEEYECIFLNGSKCSIYDVRPAQCRTYPFWPSILQSRKNWQSERYRCEGIEHEAATLVGRERIEEQLNIYIKNSDMWTTDKKF